MKQYFLKTACSLIFFALITTGAFAQDDDKSSNSRNSDDIRHNDDIIVIRPKTDIKTTLTIEINGTDVKVNGKPLSEYKSDDVVVSKHKESNIKREIVDEADLAPRSRFRGGNSYSYSGPDNNMRIETMNSNKAFLGVGTEKAEEGEGITVVNVTEGSAAEKAGLKKGDIITKINDAKINSPEELTRTIGKFNPEEKIIVTYKRDKKEQKATAVLSKRKNEFFSYSMPNTIYKNFNFDNNNSFNLVWGKPRLGLKAQETEEGKGLKVLGVDDESAAEKAGIKEGDIITSFDGQEVNNIDVLRDLAKPAMDKVSFKIKLLRDGKEQEIDVKIPKNLKTTNL